MPLTNEAHADVAPHSIRLGADGYIRITVFTETHPRFDAGVGMMLTLTPPRTHALTPETSADGASCLHLTPDACDELAAMLVAHAWDRRRIETEAT
jgi:hypothetical protein